MRIGLNALTRPAILLGLMLLPVVAASSVVAGELQLEALLVWGSNDPQPPDPKLKKVCPEVEKKLKCLPFKWSHFYEVNRVKFSVAEGETQKVTMSKDCVVSVKNLGNANIEACLTGKGERTCKISRSLPKGEMLVTGGNAPNLTGWFVVLRQVE